MVIQHNLCALNANRNLGVIAKNFKKSTEKLSSGYKINRAGDNAAGLAISEKMRGQIRGLSKSSENAEDGISLIQTAEGAMQESQNILHRMRELSVQAANDTNTTDDRNQIKVEMEQLRQELDHIAEGTEFNTKKLINGDCSLKAKDVQTRVQEYLKGSWLQDSVKRVQDAIGLSFTGDITLKVEFENLGQGTVAQMEGYFLGDDFTLKINSDMIANTSLGDWNTSSGPKIGGILTDRVIAHEVMHGIMMQNFSDQNTPLWFVEGIAEAIQGHDRTDPQTAAQAKTNIASGNEYERGYYLVSYMRHNITAGTFDDFLGDMKTMSFDDAVKKYYGDASAGDLESRMKNLAAANIDGFLTAAHITLGDGLDDSITDWDAAPKEAVPNGGGPMNIESSKETMALGKARCKITWDSTNYEGKGLRIQVGANAGQEILINMGNMKSKELIGADDIDVSSFQAATTSISRFDGAIQKVSTYRAKLGAIQNRLEHTISNLDNSAENLQASESTIRDTDMADEMTRYSKNSILMQAGQSMLAQANQSTQGVMSLLQ